MKEMPPHEIRSLGDNEKPKRGEIGISAEEAQLLGGAAARYRLTLLRICRQSGVDEAKRWLDEFRRRDARDTAAAEEKRARRAARRARAEARMKQTGGGEG